MGVLLPAAVLTNAAALVLTRQDRRSPAVVLRALGLIGQLITLGLTVGIELPINARVLTWSPAAPPDGWQRVRDRWAAVHTARTISAVVGLASLGAASTNDR